MPIFKDELISKTLQQTNDNAVLADSLYKELSTSSFDDSVDLPTIPDMGMLHLSLSKDRELLKQDVLNKELVEMSLQELNFFKKDNNIGELLTYSKESIEENEKIALIMAIEEKESMLEKILDIIGLVIKKIVQFIVYIITKIFKFIGMIFKTITSQNEFYDKEKEELNEKLDKAKASLMSSESRDDNLIDRVMTADALKKNADFSKDELDAIAEKFGAFIELVDDNKAFISKLFKSGEDWEKQAPDYLRKLFPKVNYRDVIKLHGNRLSVLTRDLDYLKDYETGDNLKELKIHHLDNDGKIKLDIKDYSNYEEVRDFINKKDIENLTSFMEDKIKEYQKIMEKIYSKLEDEKYVDKIENINEMYKYEKDKIDILATSIKTMPTSIANYVKNLAWLQKLLQNKFLISDPEYKKFVDVLTEKGSSKVTKKQIELYTN